ncbi:helix-turn-helix domain-containing protein [Embleya hyalina]|uniref:XRE family transcriptional regulator n=1 Tax=Embleya hyalina TaxID=516124 RepID=A0A401YVR2_9ACTN|nr:helix-turn-helix transcriptional regulator [Embleya hyalina]GCD98656.1 XRE family transcriptional regulator [Embleya hyalina]
MSTITHGLEFPAELRRRRLARRLSQLELAARAGTSQRHLSFIESGRSRPGRTMIIRLAESLELSLRERNALLHTAGFAPVFPESDWDAPMMRPVQEALGAVIEGHLPYPAMVLRPYGQIVAANAAIDVLTDGAAPELLGQPMNMLRLMLHPQGMAPRVENLATWGHHVLENMRARALRSPDPLLDTFIEELRGYVPSPEPGPDHLGFAVPLRLWDTASGVELRLLTTLTSFATATDVTVSELHLEAFLPADEATATALRRRAAERA